jgi:glycosyltransferase involved in cell wall biosynthesis
VLEALACGLPTLTSNLSSIPEVAGDAALLVDPHNIEQIASGLELLLCDPNLRDELRRRALIQSAKFTWAKTAAETMRVYQSAT